jgi:glutathione S-transferase
LKTVPVVEHDGEFRSDSWAIVEWLDETFPAHRLFSGPAEHAMVRFFDRWFGTQVLPPMFRSCVIDIFNHVKPEERAYFRATREALVGQTLEAVAAEAHRYIARMNEGLLPLRQQPYLGGQNPNYADHIAWSAFVGFAPIVTVPLLEPNDPISPWLARGRSRAGAA